jgi:hypothetical protein
MAIDGGDHSRDYVADPFDVVLSSCIGYFSILDLLHISCTSQSLKKLCEAKLSEGSKRPAQALLLQYVKEAAQGPGCEEKLGKLQLTDASAKAAKAHCWLIITSRLRFSLSKDHETEDTVTRLLHTSSVPFQVVGVLVAAGLCPTYAQLTAAARHGVRDVPNWVRAISLLKDNPASVMPGYVERMWSLQDICREGLLQVIASWH